MHIAFYVEHSYYWPQFEPVARLLVERGEEVTVVCEVSAVVHTSFFGVAIERVEGHEKAAECCLRKGVDWFVAGNGFSCLTGLPSNAHTALMMHGTDVSFKKACETEALGGFDVRFVGSPGRLKQLETLYPETEMVVTGYAKLAPLFPLDNIEVVTKTFPRILYAPTFYPSSLLNMPADWPAVFADCKIVIKPHQFTFTKKRYRKEKELLERWGGMPNVRIEANMEAGLLQCMIDADIMISDASSATFEFAALGKPVAIANFPRLRWTYRGPLHYRYRRRMAESVPDEARLFHFSDSAKDLFAYVNKMRGSRISCDLEQQRLIESAVGKRDGLAALRVVERLMSGGLSSS